jgi:dienelactone hydrolase
MTWQLRWSAGVPADLRLSPSGTWSWSASTTATTDTAEYWTWQSTLTPLHVFKTPSLNWALRSTSWREGNETHAQDMFSVQYGTAQDVSLLISLLPAYLPPTLRVELWACVGVSLGGHSTWLALLHDPRIAVGVPIIGCCDYLALMRNRLRSMLAKRSTHDAKKTEEDYLPEGLKSALGQLDAAGMGERAIEKLKEKKILVLCGADDRLVPYSCSQQFIELLQQAMSAAGVCEVVVEEGKGHELTDSMVAAAGDFLLRWACAVPIQVAHESRL